MKKPNFVKTTKPVFKKCSKVPLSLALAGVFFAPGLQATEVQNLDLEEIAKSGRGPLLASHALELEPVILKASVADVKNSKAAHTSLAEEKNDSKAAPTVKAEPTKTEPTKTTASSPSSPSSSGPSSNNNSLDTTFQNLESQIQTLTSQLSSTQSTLQGINQNTSTAINSLLGINTDLGDSGSFGTAVSTLNSTIDQALNKLGTGEASSSVSGSLIDEAVGLLKQAVAQISTDSNAIQTQLTNELDSLGTAGTDGASGSGVIGTLGTVSNSYTQAASTIGGYLKTAQGMQTTMNNAAKYDPSLGSSSGSTSSSSSSSGSASSPSATKPESSKPTSSSPTASSPSPTKTEP
ncbi:hypothetical protein, partial [Helicobacter heilmannii]|uniref:hypothetical protein n=1 Tax=Helicobacter heilmannii TaxID=35817 RepID=UPI0012E2E8BA